MIHDRRQHPQPYPRVAFERLPPPAQYGAPITLIEFLGEHNSPPCFASIHGLVSADGMEFLVTGNTHFQFPIRNVRGRITGAATIQRDEWVGKSFGRPERSTGGKFKFGDPAYRNN